MIENVSQNPFETKKINQIELEINIRIYNLANLAFSDDGLFTSAGH